MILVDTSVWISHLRRHNQRLDDLLGIEIIFCHPLIIGEMSCGNLKDRSSVLSLLEELPGAPVVTHQEALGFIEQRRLMGLGLSFIDVHLLASCQVAGLSIWTEDKPLQRAAQHLRLMYH
ncbi:MAG: type II toxin-antitoxin system VapC family toxin [Candidatus Omnitrophica bacterium]|nr:type II toxin-antitoxin system VapC family toxin [Candidatus Omnitrophota bacterium]